MKSLISEETKESAKAITGLIALFILLIYFVFLYKPIVIQKQEVTTIDTTLKHRDLGNLYVLAINHLKQKEGLCKKPIVSCSGQITIGYGHVVKKFEKFTTMDEKQATILLKEDLNKAINFVESNTNLRGNQSLAIGMLAFNIGGGKLLEYIKQDSLLEGNNMSKILNYCHYYSSRDKSQAKLITSKALRERREFELFIYNWYNEEPK